MVLTTVKLDSENTNRVHENSRCVTIHTARWNTVVHDAHEKKNTHRHISSACEKYLGAVHRSWTNTANGWYEDLMVGMQHLPYQTPCHGLRNGGNMYQVTIKFSVQPCSVRSIGLIPHYTFTPRVVADNPRAIPDDHSTGKPTSTQGPGPLHTYLRAHTRSLGDYEKRKRTKLGQDANMCNTQ